MVATGKLRIGTDTILEPLNKLLAVVTNDILVNCPYLKAVGGLKTSNSLTTITTIFGTCSSLTLAPLFNTINITGAPTPYTNCRSLRVAPQYNFTITTINNWYSSCSSLIEGSFVTVTNLINYVGKLEAPALNRIYNNLSLTAPTATLTVSSNPGFAASTQAIATGKGWTLL